MYVEIKYNEIMEQLKLITLKNIRHSQGKMYTHLVSCNDNGLHSHDFVEVIYITNGSIIHTCNGEKEVLSAGDMCCLMPGAAHTFSRTESCTHRDVIFDCDFFFSACNLIQEKLADQFKGLSPKRKYRITSEEISAFESMLSEYNRYLLEDDGRGSCLAMEVAARIIKIILGQSNPSSKQPLPPWLSQIVDRFQSLEHIRGGLPMILSGIPYNEIYINRVFKKYYGQSISSYLTELRLGYAEIALLTTNETVESIIKEYGFSSQTFFFKRFKEKYGVTPDKYRKSKIQSKG